MVNLWLAAMPFSCTYVDYFEHFNNDFLSKLALIALLYFSDNDFALMINWWCLSPHTTSEVPGTI